MSKLIPVTCWLTAAGAVLYAAATINPQALLAQPLFVPGLLLLSFGLFTEARRYRLAQLAVAAAETRDND